MVAGGEGNDTLFDCAGHDQLDANGKTDACTLAATQSSSVGSETSSSCLELSAVVIQ